VNPAGANLSMEPPLDHIELLARVRFSLDHAMRLSPGAEKSRAEFMANEITRTRREFVRVTPRLMPSVHRAVAQAASKLMLAHEPEVYVESDPTPNASAIMHEDQYVIRLHSGLVTLLAPEELASIVGHEIGHATLRHSFDIPRDEAQETFFHELRRAQEVSADRAGLLSVEDPIFALRAELKVACGLGAPYISADMDEFIAHISAAREDHDAPWEAETTHPHLSLRFWAQQRFIESDVFRALRGESGGTPLDTIEKEIEERFLGAGSSAAFRATADHVHEALAWLGVMIVAEDSEVTEDERSVLVEFVGKIWADDATVYARRHGLEAVERRAVETLAPLRFSNQRSRMRIEKAVIEFGMRTQKQDRATAMIQLIAQAIAP
jgi:hypothetical protein